ncbi:hypothetical protein C3F09_06845 [candidate division GN15 bacterium]|uniref:HEAT repeat domain-containing protein n=1 Tax=candidate division GN15 bacterium TaxID=2072418 RepID=A0A855X6M0_9BACT|nr:MAG: hypothetical protein C3F09_06845 [candidate division GN15 bacterium]
MGYDLSKEQKRLHDVKLVLKDLLKVVKVVAMYPEGNPLPQSLRQSFAGRLIEVVRAYGDVKLFVSRDSISLGDETVYADSSKEESLASLFFDPGITSITFKEGLETAEVYRLLDLLKEYNNTNRRSDLVAQIWEADLTGITLTTVEDISLTGYEGDFHVAELFDLTDNRQARDIHLSPDQIEIYNSIFGALDSSPAAAADLSGSGKIQADDSQPLKRPDPNFFAVSPDEEAASVTGPHRPDEGPVSDPAAQAMGFADLSAPADQSAPTLSSNAALMVNEQFKLAEDEQQRVTGILIDDAGFDPYESTIELMKEMLFQEAELPEFSETLRICEKVMNEFIRAGRLAEAGQMLSHFSRLQGELKSDKRMWGERLKDVCLMAGSRARLQVLREALDQNESVSGVELRRYLDLLGWEALEGLVDLLGELQHESHRRALCDYLVAHGRDHLPLIGKGVFDKRWFVVRNAVMILAQINDDRAVTYLEKAVGHQERRVRLEVLHALRNAVNPKAVKILQRAALDGDAEIRRLALDSLLAQPRTVAFEVTAALVGDDRFTSVDRDDQQRILNAYSMLGGEEVVDYLKSLIERHNLWRDSTLAFLREAGFEALCHNRSEQAEQVLVSLSGSWMPGMKQRAQAALRRRREIIFGGRRD